MSCWGAAGAAANAVNIAAKSVVTLLVSEEGLRHSKLGATQDAAEDTTCSPSCQTEDAWEAAKEEKVLPSAEVQGGSSETSAQESMEVAEEAVEMAEAKAEWTQLQLQELTAANDRLASQVEAGTEELQKLEVDLKRNRLELDTGYDEKTQLDHEIATVRQQVKEAKHELETLKVELRKVNKETEAMQAQLSQAAIASQALEMQLEKGRNPTMRAPTAPPFSTVSSPGPTRPSSQVRVNAPKPSSTVVSTAGKDESSSADSKFPTARTPTIVPFGITSRAGNSTCSSKRGSPKPYSTPGGQSRRVASTPTPASEPVRASPYPDGKRSITEVRQALAQAEAMSGKASAQAMHAALELAQALEDEDGTSEECGILLGHALAGFKRLYGNDHLDTLRAANSLAVHLDNAGDKQEAFRLYKLAKDGREKKLGAAHPLTLDSMYNLASFLWHTEQPQEAMKEFSKVREGCLKCFGLNHQGTLDCTERLMNIFEELGDLAGATALGRQLVKGLEENFGHKHESTLEAMARLSALLAACPGVDLTEALEAHRLALQRHQEALGVDNPLTLELTSTLVECLANNDLAPEAEQLLRQSWQACEKLQGSDSTVVLGFMEDLAILLASGEGSDEDRVRESEMLFQRVLASKKKMLGEAHEETLCTSLNLAMLLDQHDQSQAALQLYIQVRDARMLALGGLDPKTIESTVSLAVCLVNCGRTSEAAVMLECQLASLDASALDSLDDLALLCADKLGAIMNSQGELEKAEVMFQRVYDAKAADGSRFEAQEIGNASYNLAVNFSQQGQAAKAECFYRHALKVYSEAFSNDDSYCCDAMLNLAACLEEQGRLAEAEPLYQAAAKGLRNSLGAQSNESVEAEAALRHCQATLHAQNAEVVVRS